MTALAYADTAHPDEVDPADTHDKLIQIFQRVLGREPVGLDDDFLDLGGDSILAIELMAEIEQVFGRELPMTTIYDAPTVRELAVVIAEQTRPVSTSLVLLKPGDATTALFIAHGLGGSVMELRQVANTIETDHAVYGIEARGLDGSAEPFDRIESMARFYVGEIRRIQPQGPYLLAGFSFGGLVALEMAQLLRGEGEAVPFLALLDSFPHTRYWPLRSRFESWRRLARFFKSGTTFARLVDYHRDVLRSKSAGGAALYLASRAWRALKLSVDIFRLGAWLQRFADFPEAPNQAASRSTVIPDAVRRVQRAGEVAYRKYRPRFYDGEITFIKAQAEMRIPFDATLLWGALARKVTVQAIPTDHQNFVRASAASLAAQLTKNLRAIAGEA
jgi:acetoacetyl-CoA synthetase